MLVKRINSEVLSPLYLSSLNKLTESKGGPGEPPNPEMTPGVDGLLKKEIGKGTVYNKIIIACFVVLGLWIVYLYYQDSRVERIRDIQILELALTSPKVLCPGDTLQGVFELHVEGEGVIVRDTSIQQTEPLQTIIFSEMLRSAVIGPISEQISFAWKVPPVFFDYRKGMETQMQPGKYYQVIAVSSVGRSSITVVRKLEFQIEEAEKCKT